MTDETKLTEVQSEVPAQPEAAAPEVPAEPPAPADPDAEAIAAFDKGIAEAAAEEAEPEPDEPAETAEPPEAEAQPEKPEAAPAEPAAEPTDAEKHAAEVEEEIESLQLKEKAAARFRELAARPSEAEVEPLRAAAARAEQWEQIIAASTAKPEQLNSALGYVQAINSGDPAAMGQAFDAMSKELAWLGQQLGREVPGLVDPLAAHADLAREVDEGDLTRERALEIARQRTEHQRLVEHQQRQAEQHTGQQRHEQAVQSAMRQIGELNAQLKASDPAFAAKLPLLQPALDIIRANLPPQQWAAAIQQAWTKIPAPPAPPPKPAVAPMPMRPTGAPATQARKPANDMEAFEMGLARAR